MGPPSSSINSELDAQEILRFIVEKERLTKTLRQFGVTKEQLLDLFCESAVEVQVDNSTPKSNPPKKNKSSRNKDDKAEKSEKSDKAETFEKNDKTDKPEKNDKADKVDKSEKTGKVDKSDGEAKKTPSKNSKSTNTSTKQTQKEKTPKAPEPSEDEDDLDAELDNDDDAPSSARKNSKRQSSPRGRRTAILEPEHYVYQRLLIYSDGAARGNPGESGAGVVLKTPEGEEVGRFGKYLGRKTNNYAEYQAVLLGLRHAREFGASEITILSDSELLVRQLLGEYRVRASHLRELFDQVKGLLTLFEKYQVKRIGREKNAEADSMANRAIDEKL